MKRITRQDLANTAAQRWRETHTGPQGDRYYQNKAIQKKLDALGPEPDPDDVDEATGAKWWTWLSCYVCDEAVAEAVCIEFDFDGREAEVSFCQSCINGMAALIGGGP